MLEFLEDIVGGPFGAPYNEIISSGITLVILFLFFLAIVKGKEAAIKPPTKSRQSQ